MFYRWGWSNSGEKKEGCVCKRCLTLHIRTWNAPLEWHPGQYMEACLMLIQEEMVTAVGADGVIWAQNPSETPNEFNLPKLIDDNTLYPKIAKIRTNLLTEALSTIVRGSVGPLFGHTSERTVYPPTQWPSEDGKAYSKPGTFDAARSLVNIIRNGWMRADTAREGIIRWLRQRS